MSISDCAWTDVPEFMWQIQFECNYRCSYCKYVKKENGYLDLDRDIPASMGIWVLINAGWYNTNGGNY